MDTNDKVGAGPRDAEEWKPWAANIIRQVRGALDKGISAELYSEYPTPAEGFCFELHADLPYGRPGLLAEVKTNMGNMPEFQELAIQFRQKYGCEIL
jgi:hypothetical protein